MSHGNLKPPESTFLKSYYQNSNASLIDDEGNGSKNLDYYEG